MSLDPISLLQDLIRIPSVNPDHSSSTEHTGEQAMADFLAPILTDIGFSVQQDEVRPERPNLIARAPGNDTRKRVLLCPHSDTVSVDNMTIDPFGGEVRDDKIWGRGSSDTKGSMATMLAGLYANREKLASLPVAFDFVAFMGEESSQYGSKDFAKKYADQYDFAIAGEPTMLDMVYVTKGSLWFTVATTGKAAHSSQPQLGENAIMTMARSLDLMNRKLANRLSTYSHEVLGHSTINIGTISGGTIPNIVPDFCSASIDIRFTPDLENDIGAIGLVEAFIAENKLPLKISKAASNPPMECPTEHEVIALIQKARPESKLVGAPWFSDAAHLSAAGIPSLAFGPGSIDQAHTKDEFIKVEDFLDGVSFFEKFIGLQD